MKNLIPTCFYPTKKIILDDDIIFSDSILLKMHDKHFSSYTSPHCLLNYLLKDYNPLLRQADLFEKEPINSGVSVHYNLHIPLIKFKSIAADSFRHDISVALIDYHMPSMTGIDFVNKIKNLPFKKILITGEQDYSIGVDALNAGLVDAYIRKDDPDLLNQLNILINALEWKYFTDLSASTYNILEYDYLKNEVFLDKFKQLIVENNITAFFLINQEGDFSGFDTEGKQSFIVVRSKKQLQELSILAEEDGASNEIINHLAKSEVIPFFGDKQYWEVPAMQWDKFLYPANTLAGDASLAWAFISSDSQPIKKHRNK